MTTQEAITYLKVNPSGEQEPVKVLIASYEELADSYAAVGPRLLQEMQEAADWQAIAIRQQRLLKGRKLPGMDAVITEFLSKLEITSNNPTKT